MSVAIQCEPRARVLKVRDAVFLHSGWRTAATWIWSEFRELPGVVGFYEPLHESLADLRCDRIELERPDAWNSRHPGNRPYFEEFAALMGDRRPGVPGYRRAFAYDRYFLCEHEEQPGLRSYLQGLLDHAHANDRTPVLKFARSLGRVGWLRRCFPQAAHLLVMRDPLAQWLSAWRHARLGNPFFLAAPLAILARNDANVLVSSALAALDLSVRDARQWTMRQTYSACVRRVVVHSPIESYRHFLAFWIATALASVAHADATIDAGLLARSALYRSRVEHTITEFTGLAPHFHSSRPSDLGIVDTGLPMPEVVRLHEAARCAFEPKGAAWLGQWLEVEFADHHRDALFDANSG